MTPQSPAPVAGRPLTAEDVEIIRDYWSAYADADWHLIPEAIRDDFDARLVAAGLAEWRDVTPDDLEDAFAHDRGLEASGSCLDLTPLGRLAFGADSEGWIFNSEGWAENPVPGATIEYRCRSGSTWALPVSVPSDALRWGNSGWSGDIIAFRPHAPVSRPGDGVAGESKRAAIMREVKAYAARDDVGSAWWVNALTGRIMEVTK